MEIDRRGGIEFDMNNDNEDLSIGMREDVLENILVDFGERKKCQRIRNEQPRKQIVARELVQSNKRLAVVTHCADRAK